MWIQSFHWFSAHFDHLERPADLSNNTMSGYHQDYDGSKSFICCHTLLLVLHDLSCQTTSRLHDLVHIWKPTNLTSFQRITLSPNGIWSTIRTILQTSLPLTPRWGEDRCICINRGSALECQWIRMLLPSCLDNPQEHHRACSLIPSVIRQVTFYCSFLFSRGRSGEANATQLSQVLTFDGKQSNILWFIYF